MTDRAQEHSREREAQEKRLEEIRKRVTDEDERAFRETPRPLLSSEELARRVETQREENAARPKRLFPLRPETWAILRGGRR